MSTEEPNLWAPLYGNTYIFKQTTRGTVLALVAGRAARRPCQLYPRYTSPLTDQGDSMWAYGGGTSRAGDYPHDQHRIITSVENKAAAALKLTQFGRLAGEGDRGLTTHGKRKRAAVLPLEFSFLNIAFIQNTRPRSRGDQWCHGIDATYLHFNAERQTDSGGGKLEVKGKKGKERAEGAVASAQGENFRESNPGRRREPRRGSAGRRSACAASAGLSAAATVEGVRGEPMKRRGRWYTAARVLGTSEAVGSDRGRGGQRAEEGEGAWEGAAAACALADGRQGGGARRRWCWGCVRARAASGAGGTSRRMGAGGWWRAACWWCAAGGGVERRGYCAEVARSAGGGEEWVVRDGKQKSGAKTHLDRTKRASRGGCSNPCSKSCYVAESRRYGVGVSCSGQTLEGNGNG
ncbi:hypothetical protein FB451DRAFT_1184251 [Mycena latifolia]|nr:hypothetical protein FB451DRAFT_1184251 [Mycena latifolia]